MDYKKLYIDFLKQAMDVRKPLTVVFDASNGATGILLKDLWAGTNVNAIVIHDDIDPNFSAHGPNPLSPGASDDCANKIRENNADLGVMFDADGDRAMFLDHKGNMIPACFIAALIFKECEPLYVADELIHQSLKMLKIFPEGKILPSRIGAAFLKEMMREHKASAGGEYSGHYFFSDFFNLDSGLFAAIKVINCLSKMDKSFDEWRSQFGEHIIKAKEIKTAGKDMKNLYSQIETKYTPLSSAVERRDGYTFIFPTYWINVRSSNTEPIMRIIGGGGHEMDKTFEDLERMVHA